MRVCVRVNTVRQNRKERLMQKKWSHINPLLIGPLDEKEVSLKVNELINQRFPTSLMRSFSSMGVLTKMRSIGSLTFNFFLVCYLITPFVGILFTH